MNRVTTALIGFLVGFVLGAFILLMEWSDAEKALKLKIAQGTYDCELYHEQVICYEVGE